MKIPISLPFISVFRIFLPGFIISMSLMPWIMWFFNSINVSEATKYAFFAFVIFFGWLLVTCDMHIHMLYEGRRYWPAKIKQFFITKENKRLEKCTLKQRDAHQKLASTNELDNKLYLESIYLEMSVQRRQFPIDEQTGERVAKLPTRFGNILTMYEGYPKVMYGLDGVFFWYRIWLLVPKEVRDEFESLQSYADSTVYSSFAFYISGIIALTYIAAEFFGVKIIVGFPFYVWLLCSVTAFVAGFLIYRLSLHLHSQFGETWKSIFDVYRTKLDAVNVKDDIAVWTGDKDFLSGKTAREKNDIIFSYLQYFKIKCPRTGRGVIPHQYLKECADIGDDEVKRVKDVMADRRQENR